MHQKTCLIWLQILNRRNENGKVCYTNNKTVIYRGKELSIKNVWNLHYLQFAFYFLGLKYPIQHTREAFKLKELKQEYKPQMQHKFKMSFESLEEKYYVLNKIYGNVKCINTVINVQKGNIWIRLLWRWCIYSDITELRCLNWHWGDA